MKSKVVHWFLLFVFLAASHFVITVNTVYFQEQDFVTNSEFNSQLAKSCLYGFLTVIAWVLFYLLFLKKKIIKD